MNLFEPAQVQGNAMQLSRTHDNHFAGRREPIPAPVQEHGFRDALVSSLEDVNAQQVAHEELSVRSIVDPESVDPHDLTIAAAKATTSLSITRNVVDRVIQAYRDITNLR
ncbi:MAG: flagellar hook-basal body complex protein FliE [Alkalispirochaeta sp.]